MAYNYIDKNMGVWIKTNTIRFWLKKDVMLPLSEGGQAKIVGAFSWTCRLFRRFAKYL